MQADTVLAFWSLCQTEPCEPEKTWFQTKQQKKMYGSQELNKESEKLKLNMRMYGWTSTDEKWR